MGVVIAYGVVIAIDVGDNALNTVPLYPGID